MHLDNKNDDATGEGDEVGDEQEDTLTPEHPPLCYEGGTADGHHDESRQGDAVSIACAYGLNGDSPPPTTLCKVRCRRPEWGFSPVGSAG